MLSLLTIDQSQKLNSIQNVNGLPIVVQRYYLNPIYKVPEHNISRRSAMRQSIYKKQFEF